MAQVGNSENRFGGEFMVQDSDHMSGVDQNAHQGNRQVDQSQSRDRQQGHSDQNVGGQQGGERARKSR